MKKSTIVILAGGLAAGLWAYTIDGEPTWMEELQRHAGIGTECTVTRNVEGRDWMVCRRSPNHQGSAWLADGEHHGKAVWIAASPKADEALRKIQQLETSEREGLANVRPPRGDEDLPPVPWDRLD